MAKRGGAIALALLGAVVLGSAETFRAAQFPEARIYIEYNSTDNDLGFHVSLDAEDWKVVTIADPSGSAVFTVRGQGAFGALGLTELFFEGAEPPLDEVPLNVLLGMMPEGQYAFTGEPVGGGSLVSRARLSHAVPAGPVVSTEVDGDLVVIRWAPVTGTPPGFPARRIQIAGYQVIVGSFEVTLPATSTSVTIPEEYVRSLAPGAHGFEVLAIDQNGNQTITSSTFETD